MFIFLYGNDTKYENITSKIVAISYKNNYITMPSSDSERASLYGDPYPGHIKHIIYFSSTIIDGEIISTYQIYQPGNVVIIDMSAHNIKSLSYWLNDIKKSPSDILQILHNKLKIEYGSFKEEYPEQLMSAMYILPTDKVLEIGGNIGRNSLIIASLLEDDKNLVTLECDKNTVSRLTYNRDINNLHFNIESSALSYQKLIQLKWNTIPSDVLLPGYKWIDTITFDEIQSKYNIIFDTFVLDCEGAFYFILKSNTELLNNIKKIIVENDYGNITHKQFVDSILTSYQFKRDYVKSGGFGPCKPFFYEVWIKYY